MYIRGYILNTNGLYNIELCTGFSVLHQGSPVEKIRFAFNCYDADCNGRITSSELFMIIRSIRIAKGVKTNINDIKMLCNQYMNEFDIYGRGYLTFNEFSKLVHSKPFLIQAFFKF